jgi:hypothetical protein
MSARDDRRQQTDVSPPDEPFLSRWARLKRAAREGDGAAAEPPAESPAAAEAAPVHSDPPSDEEGPAGASLAELPSLDSLTEDSDFGAFMAAGVSPELRRQALRKMFRNPKYHVLDPLDPFRADFAAFTALGSTITSDMKYHAERLLREQLEKAAAAAEGGDPAPADGPQAKPSGQAGADVSASGDVTTRDDANTGMEDGDERREG